MKTKGLLGDVASQLGGAFDDAILSAMRARFGRARPARPRPASHREDRRALLAEAIAFYRQPEILSGERFFVRPPTPSVRIQKRGALERGAVFDLAWESAFEPAWPAVRADYLTHSSNRTAHARLLAHEKPRATIVCLHGYRGGSFFVEERAFATSWLYGMGLDVVLFTLPFHGLRAIEGALPWPSANVGRTNEGFGQAIFDLRALMAWLRERGTEWPIAVCGMSLGGYTTALLSTIEPLAFAAPIIPVADFAELLWRHGEGRPERERAEREGITLEMLRDAMQVVTPLRRQPLVPADRMLVLSARGDRIVPPEHASRLAEYFGCEEVRFPGGHILQLGRGKAFRALAQRLGAAGLIDRR